MTKCPRAGRAASRGRGRACRRVSATDHRVLARPRRAPVRSPSGSATGPMESADPAPTSDRRCRRSTTTPIVPEVGAADDDTRVREATRRRRDSARRHPIGSRPAKANPAFMSDARARSCSSPAAASDAAATVYSSAPSVMRTTSVRPAAPGEQAPPDRARTSACRWRRAVTSMFGHPISRRRGPSRSGRRRPGPACAAGT